jgi:hypothetical protein
MQLCQLPLQRALLLLQLAQARDAELVGDGDVPPLLLCEACCLEGTHPVALGRWVCLASDEVDVMQLKGDCRRTE